MELSNSGQMDPQKSGIPDMPNVDFAAAAMEHIGVHEESAWMLPKSTRRRDVIVGRRARLRIGRFRT